MSYGHAERNLALIRQLEAEIRQWLGNQVQPEQGLPEPAGPGSQVTAPSSEARTGALGALTGIALQFFPSGARYARMTRRISISLTRAREIKCRPGGERI